MSDQERTVRLTMDHAAALRDAAILWLGTLQHWGGRGDQRIEEALEAVRGKIAAARKGNVA